MGVRSEGSALVSYSGILAGGSDARAGLARWQHHVWVQSLPHALLGPAQESAEPVQKP